MKEESNLKDLIYFDIDKASSLLSQFEGGLPEKISESHESGENNRSLKQADMKVFKYDFGGIETDKSTRIQTKILHHDLLNRIERLLFDHALAIDLNKAYQDQDFDQNTFQDLIKNISYVQAEGLCFINDFENLSMIMSNFKTIAEFINQCNKQEIENSDEFRKMKQELESEREQVKNVKDRNAKAKKNKILDEKEKRINKAVEQVIEKIDLPDDWLIEGIKHWIEIFNQEQVHFRIKPFDNYPDLELIANLKKDSFVDSNIDHTIFSYGTRPNVKLTILGLITANPSKSTVFQTIKYDLKNSGADEQTLKTFEMAFLEVFKAMDNFTAFSRFSNSPNLTLYPIAVYRKIESYIKQEDS